MPPPKKDDVIAALNPLADASRKGAGNLRFEVVQQTSRPNHFTVIEAWKDQKAYDARGSAARSANSATSSADAGRALRRAALSPGRLSADEAR